MKKSSQKSSKGLGAMDDEVQSHNKSTPLTKNIFAKCIHSIQSNSIASHNTNIHRVCLRNQKCLLSVPHDQGQYVMVLPTIVLQSNICLCHTQLYSTQLLTSSNCLLHAASFFSFPPAFVSIFATTQIYDFFSGKWVILNVSQYCSGRQFLQTF